MGFGVSEGCGFFLNRIRNVTVNTDCQHVQAALEKEMGLETVDWVMSLATLSFLTAEGTPDKLVDPLDPMSKRGQKLIPPSS